MALVINCGINDAAIQKRLLSEGDSLTLTNALQHAIALELAMRDSKDIHPSSVEPVHSIRTGAKHQKPRVIIISNILQVVVALNVAVTDVD